MVTRAKQQKKSTTPKRKNQSKKADRTIETVDITPSPRILKVIAEIDFRPWQCIAELVDNSFDEFLHIERDEIPWPETFEVSVTLPGQKTPNEEKVVVVRDNGRGMTLEQVRNAVRAGHTTNDPV